MRCPLIGLKIIILLVYCFHLQFSAQMKQNFIAKERYATHMRNIHMHNTHIMQVAVGCEHIYLGGMKLCFVQSLNA